MKKNMEALERMYKEELELAEKHKKKAFDIKKEMELQRGGMIHKKANALNMTGAEYDRFIKLLEKDKKTVMDAVDLVLGGSTERQERREGRREDEDARNRNPEGTPESSQDTN